MNKEEFINRKNEIERLKREISYINNDPNTSIYSAKEYEITIRKIKIMELIQSAAIADNAPAADITALNQKIFDLKKSLIKIKCSFGYISGIEAERQTEILTHPSR